jgi:hypothetical protein
LLRRALLALQARYSALMTALYGNMNTDDGGQRLYWPLANYDNPVCPWHHCSPLVLERLLRRLRVAFCMLSRLPTSIQAGGQYAKQAEDASAMLLQVWWGLMCMAQSATSFNGLESAAGLDIRSTGGRSVAEIIATSPPAKGSRADAAAQLWGNLVAAWVEYGERGPVRCALLVVIAALVAAWIEYGELAPVWCAHVSVLHSDCESWFAQSIWA